MELKRMWINQPSVLQPLHHLHGTNVLAIREYDGMYRVYFLAGNIICQRVPGFALSDGWCPSNKATDGAGPVGKKEAA